MQTRISKETLAAIALAGIAYFAVVMVGLHLLPTGADVVGRPASDYAIGDYANLMKSAFLALTVCCPALALGLYREIEGSYLAHIGLLLLAFFGLSTLVAAVFPIDARYYAPTIHGTIHHIAAASGFLAVTIAAPLLSRRFARYSGWSDRYRAAMTLSFAMILSYIGMVVGFMGGLGFGGLAQRFFFAVFIVWFVMVASRLRAVAVAQEPAVNQRRRSK